MSSKDELPARWRRNSVTPAETTSRSQRILGGKGDETVVLAAAAMTAFERMWGGIYLLTRDHPKRKMFLDMFLETLKPIMQQNDRLRLDVEPYAFKVDGQEVLKIDRPNQNYIYRLYQDGVRQLVFHENITNEELERFLDVFGQIFGETPSEDDIVTLLWDADLEGITYQAIEFFSEGSGDAPEDGPSQADATVGVDDIVKWATCAVPVTDARIDTSQLIERRKGFRADDRKIRRQAPELLDGVVEDTQKQAEGVFSFTPAEKKEIHDRLRAQENDIGAKFGEILFFTLQALGESASQGVRKAFGEFTIESIEHQTLKPILDAARAIDALDESPGAQDVKREILGDLHQDEIITVLIERSGIEETRKETAQLLRFISIDGFPALWKRLQSTNDPSVRNDILGHLETSAPRHQYFLIDEVIDGDENQALLALDLLLKTDYSLVFKELLPGLHNESAAVRRGVLNLMMNAKDPAIQKVIQKVLPRMLRDPDEKVRLKTIDILVRMRIADPENSLLSVIRDPSFETRSDNEKLHTISALGRVTTGKGLAVLREIALGSKTPRVDQVTRIEAIRILGSRGDRESLSSLEKLSKAFMASKEIKKAAGMAVKTIRYRKASHEQR